MKSKKQTLHKVLEKILIVILLIVLTMFHFLYATSGIVIAVYEGLEQQENNTNHKDVKFDTYLKTDTQNLHETEVDIKEEAKLTFYFGVDTGNLNNAKILLEDSNFQLKEAEDKYIKHVNTETNELELNQIIANDGIEITVPIEFKKVEELNKEYFSKETSVKLTGKYKNAENKEKEIEGEVKVKITWTEEPQIALEQDIEKYVNLEGETTLIQQKINSQITNNTLVQSKTLESAVPEIGNTLPDTVEVLINGKSIEQEKYQYDKESKMITIQDESKNSNEYKIIYIYPLKSEEDLQIELKTNIKVKLYTEQEVEEKAEKQVTATRTTNNVSIKNEATEKIYKGKIYNTQEDRTNYQEKLEIEISSLEQIEEIEIGKMQDYFKNEQGNKENANTFINNIVLNKENIVNVLGEDFEVKILGENDQELHHITKQSDWDENGNISLSIGEINLNAIKIIFSKPINIGTINVGLDKYIKGNSNYSKELSKTFTNLENTKVITVAGGQIEVNSTSILEDTVTEAKIELSNTNLLTTEKNENVQITAILKANNEKYDLYKNPYVEIRLPEELKEIEVKSIKLLYGEEFEIEKAGYDKIDKTIQIRLKGEETKYKKEVEEGIHIVINADITFIKNIPNKEVPITMLYTNENSDEKQYETNIKMNLNSKYGAILYNSIHNYDEENTTIETTEDKEMCGYLDTQEKGKQAIVHQSFINNYEQPINKVIMVGNLKQKNADAKIENIVTNNENAKVYYSDKENMTIESKDWQENTEDIEEINSYKIELEQELEPASNVDVAYKLDIPSDLEANVKINQNTNVTYYYNDQELKTKSLAVLSTEEKPLELAMNDLTKAKGITVQEQGIKTDIVVKSANKEIKDGEEIFEGQPVTYEVKITNNTGNDLNNLKLEAEHTNAVFYKTYEKESYAIYDAPANKAMVIVTEKDENLKTMTKTIEQVKNGETVTITYQLAPKKKEGNETKGNIKISADNIKEQEISTITNTIKDSKLFIDVFENIHEKYDVFEGQGTCLKFDVTNNTNEEQKDIILDIYESDLLELKEMDKEQYEEMGIEFEKYQNHQLTIKIPTLVAKETKTIKLNFKYGEMSEKEVEKEAYLYYTAKLGDSTYFSNTFKQTVKRAKANLTVKQSASVKETMVKLGDKVVFTSEISNIDPKLDANEVTLHHMVTEENAKIDKAYLKKENGEIVNIDVNKTNEVEQKLDLKAGEKIEYIAETSIWENPSEELLYDYQDQVTSNLNIKWKENGYLDANEILFDLQAKASANDSDDEEEKPNKPNESGGDDLEDDYSDGNNKGGENGDKNGNTDKNSSKQDNNKTYTISGLAWVDKNKDGIRNNDEEIIKDMPVKLLNANEGTIAVDSNNQECSIKTQNDGTYTFNNVPKGHYIVIFEYNTEIYSVTQYQKEGVGQAENSDVIQKTIQGEDVAATDRLIVNNDITNVDAGFIQNQRFDFSLNKTINKMVVNSPEGIKNIDCKGSKLAKTDINAKYADKTVVSVEYNIEVKNEGEISGYINDIIDYMPKDLEFNTQANKEWKKDNEGNLHNVSLSNTAIEPGESKNITLVLTKQMTAQNTGLSVNVAEIGQATNELNIQDEDSTPANRKDGEDDISTAELLTSIKTGAGVIITISIIIITILVGVAIGIYKIKGGK